MAQELTLRLDTPIEELIPKMIGFNNTELLTKVKASLEDYKGKTYDENSISEAKTDRATLNKFTTALNSERLRIKKVYTAPLDKFTEEVNEVIDTVNEVVIEIDSQVKDYEKRVKGEKLSQCKTYFESIIPSELKDFVPYEKIHKEEWLNISKKIGAVQKEIDEIITKIQSEIQTIEALGGDEIDLKAIYFERLSLTDAIQTNERRKIEKQRLENAKLERQKALEEMAKQEEKKGIEKPQEPQPQVEEQLYTLVFKVTGTSEQLNALKKFMAENNIKVERV